jgi:uncharacterized membrane protein YdfJ with MMPL/SSD domain
VQAAAVQPGREGETEEAVTRVRAGLVSAALDRAVVAAAAVGARSAPDPFSPSLVVVVAVAVVVGEQPDR